MKIADVCALEFPLQRGDSVDPQMLQLWNGDWDAEKPVD